MGKLILLSGACLVACGTLAAPAVAKSKSAATCNSKFYSDLVGLDVSETQKITDTYRLVMAGSDASPANPGRLTVVYDKGTGRILSIACG